MICEESKKTDKEGKLREGKKQKECGMNMYSYIYVYVYLLYFAWADQRVQQFYNYHDVSRR